MCRDVTLQPYNMAKQLQPPTVYYLLYMRESRGIQNFVIADEMEPLESQYLTIRAGMEGFQTPKSSCGNVQHSEPYRRMERMQTWYRRNLVSVESL